MTSAAPARPVAAPDREPLAGPAVLGVLAFSGVAATLVQTSIVPLLPALPRLTGSSPTDVGWLVTATLLAGAVATPLLGRAGDQFGRRRMMLLSLALLTVGSVACALTSDLGLLVAARAVQGAGAGVIPLAISLLRTRLPRERVGSGVALMSSTVGIGAALGLPLAALLVQRFDWHWMFWATSALAAAALAGVALAVPADRPPVAGRGGARFDWLGAVGLSAALTALLLAVSQGNAWGWGSARLLGCAAAAALLLVLWGHRQLRTEQPLVDLRQTARRAVLLPHLAALLAGFSFYANSLVTVQLVQEPRGTGFGLGLSVAAAGLCLLPSGLVMVAFAPVSARFSRARGPRATLAVGSAVIALGYVLRIADSRALSAVLLGSAVVSVGTALVYSALPLLVMAAVPAADTAAANGMNVLMRTIGQALCSAVVAQALSGGTLRGYQTAFSLAGTVALVACAGSALLPGRAPLPGKDGPA
ncbi:MFS transporter [Streptacidiphilus jiangxiensis]|uniref:Major Facilitator Superfamily protein n=1 Tax=Streptacidiphilus jiangxiensis TaxID=235985 RepID=A0A1H7TJK8_STRJI|nr:MFS transporter [Streptacidiphilus jiangxiensis]SEL84679.1 Major Facilitator Superfamily protein [Streptacidiphilus jiangxiensis]